MCLKCPSAPRRRVQVYDQPEGELVFEEIQGKMVIKNDLLDSGNFNVAENQQQRVFEQTAGSMAAGSWHRGDKLFYSDTIQYNILSEIS